MMRWFKRLWLDYKVWRWLRKTTRELRPLLPYPDIKWFTLEVDERKKQS